MAHRRGVGRRSGLTRRSYGQRDAVAAALDAVGDRWTLLIVRELVLGPRRWTDLLANLGGIGKNLLAQRLKELESAQLVTSFTLPWGTSRTKVYSLTEHAAQLERVVFELARFGVRQIPSSGEVRPDWAVLAFAVTTDTSAAGPTHLRVDGSWFTIETRDGEVRVRRGQHGATASLVEGSAAGVLRRAEQAAIQKERGLPR